MSLAVKDLATSKAFYEKLGFRAFAGSEAQNYLIMKNGTTNIGLFQGMFTGNLLTFNPGWNHDTSVLDQVDDVRSIQHHLQQQGVELTTTTPPDATGPGYITFTDPDGNQILIDQHL